VERQKKCESFMQEAPLSILTRSQFKKLRESRLRKLIYFCRVCSICLKNEFQQSSTAVEWKCCPRCHFGWCCGPTHWEDYMKKGIHTAEICQKYKEATEIELFHYKHIENHQQQFMNQPWTALTKPVKSFPATWSDYFSWRFGPEYQRDHPPEFWSASTRLLSQPVSCLYALYQHDASRFLQMTNLTIHVAGADSYELPATCVWEEIIHCLPRVGKD